MRLLIVSNRVALPNASGGASAGGLAVALAQTLKKHGGLWFGWSGDIVEEPVEEPRMRSRAGVGYALLDLSRAEYESYYLGFSNRALWPIMHYRPSLTDYSREQFEAYIGVNRRFAASLAPLVQPDDMIWVHDYHLIPLGAELRSLGLTNPIGYFHHIPWPAPDLFEALPASGILLRALAGYDLAGFQTAQDADNARRGLLAASGGEDVGDERGAAVAACGRRLSLGSFPIGVDSRSMQRLAARSAAEMNPRVQRALGGMRSAKLVIGVDRLDYSKGIPQRLHAFERFLVDTPEARGRVTMLQIAPPSRSEVPEYAELDRATDEIAGRINAQLAEIDWSPIRVVKKSYPRGMLAGLYRRSAVGLVTPIRDGMNLVAKEYVAAQDPADPGVLILSRFAGAARQLTTALLVNPNDVDEVAAAISEALAMPLEDRVLRHRELLANVRHEDVGWWTSAFIAALAEATSKPPGPDRARRRLRLPPRLPPKPQNGLGRPTLS